MNDVTAMIFTIGEPMFQKALDSIKNQQLKPKETIVVRNQEPVSKAFRVGISKVHTPFFLECNADMILSPDCIKVLRNEMEEGLGATIGFLQDDIMGIIQAVKLFRKEAIKPSLSSSVASDSDAIQKMIKNGWKIKFCKRKRSQFNFPKDVFGWHKPNYQDENYTFTKFSRQGTKVRYRKSLVELESLLSALKTSKHPKANIALLAFCHGFFSTDTEDQHKRIKVSKAFQLYLTVKKNNNTENAIFSPKKLSHLTYSIYP
jgi:hypothetical protein